MRQWVFFIGCCLWHAAPAQAADCQAGVAAHTAGRYDQARSILQPLAAQGDECAQYQLGEMYMQGHGVPQDQAKALVYFKQAAAKGNGKAKVMASFLEKR